MSRFKQAIHYVVASTEPAELGKVKLAKVLFYADLDAFRLTGKSITGQSYVKRQNGPMPTDFYAAIDQLSQSGKIAQRHEDFHGYTQHQFWKIEEPDLDGFTARDVDILSQATRAICKGYTAAEISELTHVAAWEFAAMGEEVPLAAFLASQTDQIRDEELATIRSQLGE
jgi:Protein of unknown function (DUF4065)